ncbi:GTPase domain-containing protein [Deltaproteobacteria bacterium OttesenSCG-928-M10]|nr:GTPase domain-containing protein [Deltaproteobacteria bacterium OttesenSCG-928-M10]
MENRQTARSITEMNQALDKLTGAFGQDEAIGQARWRLNLLADRFARPDGPLVAAVCGPTGAGKSHLVNFLAGGPVSPSSYRRPSTAAPVLVGPPETLAGLSAGGFLPAYQWAPAAAGVDFSRFPEGNHLFAVPFQSPAWPWPPELVIIDTPDFDSVRAENQLQAIDMARRADAVILVAHQAKYADQSTWDFLRAESRLTRPLLLILNRVTAAAATDDFKERLAAADIAAPVIAWPEESAVGQVGINAARQELTAWLEGLSGRSRELTAENGRRLAGELAGLVRGRLEPPLDGRVAEVERRLAGVRRVKTEWLETPRAKVAMNLPGETRESLLKSLGEVVRKSDLWDKPRRFITRPFTMAGDRLKKMFGLNEAEASAEKKLADGLAEAGREALVTAVRDEGRALAEAAGLPSPQDDLDFSPDDIRARHQAMTERMDQWLKEETAKLLAGLPLGQKAAFYLVQFMHLGLVVGLQVQTGGLPGTEVLVGGALGPVISKLTGAVISRENVAAFEERAEARHHQELAGLFQEQAERYEARLESELATLAAGRVLGPNLKIIEKEAARLWA